MTQTRWVKGPIAADLLGVSPTTMRRWRNNGAVEKGIHWRLDPSSRSYQPHILWNVEAVEPLLPRLLPDRFRRKPGAAGVMAAASRSKPV